MRITILIPVHDDGDLLLSALRSVAQQTRPPDEVIVVDDGSQDPHTRRLVDELRARPVLPQLRVLRQGNHGVAAARHLAIEHATGEALLPLDADDELLPRALELLEHALEEQPCAAFASGHVRYFGAQHGGATVPRFNPYLTLDDNTQMPLALFRAAVFRAHGLRYAPLKAFEDWGLWLAVAQAGLRGVQVEEPVYRYRRKVGQGLLAWGEARRPQLEAELRALFPQLYTRESRARLKERFAPALEIAWSGAPDDPALRDFLAAQTLPDVSVTNHPPADARGLLRAARGKVLLRLDPAQLAVLKDARASLLEQALRFLEGHPEQGGVAIPLDRATLEAASVQPRLSAFPQARLATHPLDLLFLRVAHLSGLREAHLRADAPAVELAQVVPLSLFAEDFARLVRDVPAVPPEGPPPDPSLTELATDLAARAWRKGRRGLERVVGPERLGRALHPLKLRADEWRLDADAAAQAVTHGRAPLDLQPLLPPSIRAERARLDAVPTQWLPPRPEPHQRPRVLLALPWILHGGVDRAAVDMAAALAQDHDLYAVLHVPARHDWEHRLLRHVRDVYLLGETTPTTDALVQIAQRLQIDALWLSHSWLAYESLGALKAALPQLRTADLQHMDHPTPGGDFARRAAREGWDRHLDLRFVVTDFLRKRYAQLKVPDEKIRLVRLSCDESGAFDPARVPRGALRARLGIPQDAPLVAFVGRFVEEKDPLAVVRVHAELAQLVGAHSVFVGDGPLRTQAEPLARGLGLHAHFLPPDADVAAVLRDADLLLLASHQEGLPLVLLEALSLETPVVSTAVEGIPELVDAEVGACVPDDANKERALVEAALPFLRDPARRHDAGRKGRARILRDWSSARTAARFRELFGELLRQR